MKGGSNGNIFKTNNGGYNWIPQTTNPKTAISYLFFINPNTGYAGGRDGLIFGSPRYKHSKHCLKKFALTFNVYDLPNCGELANSRSAITLTELRASLFFEQRRYRHFGYDPSGVDLDYIRKLVENIRTKVQEKQFV